MVPRRLTLAVFASLLLIAAPAAAEPLPCTPAFSFEPDVLAQVCGAPDARATATPNPAQPGEVVTLDASGSQPTDAPIDGYAWDLDDDRLFDDATTATTTVSWPAKGKHTVRLRVSSSGADDTLEIPIYVTSAPQAVLADPASGVLSGETMTLDASTSSDPDGTIVKYQWDLDGEDGYELTTSTPTTTVSWPTPGAKTVSVRVVDDTGASAVAAKIVQIVNRPPTATFSLAQAPATAGVAATLRTLDSTDPDGSIVDHRWDADGDGTIDVSSGTARSALYTYASPGTYTARLELVDDSGASVVVTQQVTVIPPNNVPVIALSATPQTADPGQEITLSASGTTDDDGTVVEYRWDTDGDGGYETSTGATPTKTVSYVNPGTVVARVKAIDDTGGFATKTIALTIRDAQAQGGGPLVGGGAQAGGTGSATPTGTGAGGPAAGGSPAGGGPATTGGDDATPRASPAVFTATLAGTAIQRRTAVSGRGVAVTCTASDRGRCIVVAQIGAADARRLGLAKSARVVQVGRATAELEAGRQATVRVTLSRAARRALQRRPSTRLVLRAIARDWFGHSLELARVVLIRR